MLMLLQVIVTVNERFFLQHVFQMKSHDNFTRLQLTAGMLFTA